MLDHTHDAQALSWVASACGHPEFPLQNLPLGVMSGADGAGRIVVAIGDMVMDVAAALDAGCLGALNAEATAALRAQSLNAWMALPQSARIQLRHALFSLLSADYPAVDDAARFLIPSSQCTMLLPAAIGDYSDFYAGIHHASKVGKLFRPDNPLMPNYKHMPIAYHGRGSSIRVSGAAVQRPIGQVGTISGPRLQPSERMDFELELAIWVGPGNGQGEAVPIDQASGHIAGYGLFNDWSARDIQAWEYQPLGPFQGKNFASTVSPWVVTAEAMAPFRGPAMPRGAEAPLVMAYLMDEQDQRSGALDIDLEVWLSTAAMRAQGLPALRLSRSHAGHLYWTPAQMIVQHTLGGCNLRPGDLLGSGTISTPDETGNGSLLEMTAGGKQSIALPSGETRSFLCDGDEVTLKAGCRREGFNSIGFGACRAIVEPARTAGAAGAQG